MSRGKIILCLIFLLGLILRFYGLDKNPPSLNWDEVSHGYNAFSILKTGTDEWGQLPVANFRAYGDYPLPLNLYLTIPGIIFFGLNEWTVRFPSALFGSLLIIITYFLTRKFTDEEGSLISAFLVAISPWTILTSRQTLQSTPAIFLITLGILFFLKGLSGKKFFLLLGVLGLGLSTYTYHNTRILAPLIFLLLFFFYRKSLIKFKLTATLILILAVLFFVPLVKVITSTEGSARSIWVGILDQGAINEINQYRNSVSLPSTAARLIYNKPAYFIVKSAANYLGYFSPEYLGLSGGTQYQFSVPNFGIVYIVCLPFFYLGLFLLFKNFLKNDLKKKFLLIWLLIGPIPAAITRDPYQVVRSTTMLPALFVVTALGFGNFLSFEKMKKWRNSFLALFILSNLIFLGIYLYIFWFNYPKQYSFAWQYGYKQAVDYIKINGDKYQTIYFTKKYGEPHEFILFYTSYDPQKYKTDPNLVRYQRSDWYWVDLFDKYVFLNDWEVKDRIKNQESRVKSLLITSPGNYPEGSTLLETINFLDGKRAFDIVEL